MNRFVVETQDSVIHHSVNLVKFLNCTPALNFHKLSFFFHSQYDSLITKGLLFN